MKHTNKFIETIREKVKNRGVICGECGDWDILPQSQRTFLHQCADYMEMLEEQIFTLHTTHFRDERYQEIIENRLWDAIRPPLDLASATGIHKDNTEKMMYFSIIKQQVENEIFSKLKEE